MQTSSHTSDGSFRVPVMGGELVGTVRGPDSGNRLLLLHGGPGLSERFFDDLIDELIDRYHVACYQQRGIPPTTARAPYDVSTQTDDAVALLDAIGWDSAVVLGHSWGGHLLLHLMAAHPDRLDGAIVVEPLGAVGDGGVSEFVDNLMSRTAPDRRTRIAELDARSEAGIGTEADHRKAFELLWPAYFSNPQTAPPYPDLPMSKEANEATFESAMDEFAGLAPRLKGSAVPTVFIHGSGSPMPVTSSTDTALLIGDTASVVVLDGPGHMIWLESMDPFCRAIDEAMVRIDTLNR
jgi:pimeloyl-ACP methyl ester carboxylesterase